jgi:NAD(P)-dependent dehydrogenase (short-subunit alcohol dehydrogenase family)
MPPASQPLTDPTDLKGRSVIISGGASGIGAATARLVSELGGAVVSIDLNAHEAPDGGASVQGSVADAETWRRAVAAADEFGTLGFVFLNAGVYGHAGPLVELSDDVLQTVLDANVRGVIVGAREVTPALGAHGGAIVATASVAGVMPFPPNPVYTMSKHAVIGFVRAVAPTLPLGVTINAVCPAVVDTPMTTVQAGLTDPSVLGVDLIAPETIGEAALALAASGESGQCHVVLSGADPSPWTFTGLDRLPSLAED